MIGRFTMMQGPRGPDPEQEVVILHREYQGSSRPCSLREKGPLHDDHAERHAESAVPRQKILVFKTSIMPPLPRMPEQAAIG